MPELKEIEMWDLIQELINGGYLLDENDNKKSSYEILNAFGMPVGSIDTNTRNIIIYTDFGKNKAKDEVYLNIVQKFLPADYLMPILPEHLRAECITTT